MELHFCHVCGVSVPNATVDAGDARDGAGKIVCSDHRSAPTTDAESAAKGDADAGEGGDLELLFCANCRISVPVTDVRAGRARREYGSLHCAICTKADPGERAARREAVEAEMAADVDADDPMAPTRCTVCSAMVPHSHIVTGKALSDGDRVTCQNCRAAALSVRASGSGGGGGFVRAAAVFLLVAGVAAGIGYGVGQLVDGMQSKGADPMEGRLASLERSVAARFDELAARIPADTSEAQREAVNRRFDRMSDDLETQLDGVRAELAGIRSELAKADVALEGRLSRLEGRVDEMSERVRDVASRPPSQPERVDPPAGGDDRPDEGMGDGMGDGDGMGGAGDAPVAPQVNPEVARLAKALLDSGEDSVRFPAANDLGRMGDDAAIPALSWALVNDKHFLVRRACARSLSQLKAWNATPYLIDALEDKEAYVAQQANFALREITAEDFDVTQDQSHAERRRKAKAARKWWEQNKDDAPEGVSLASAELIR